MNNCLVTQAGAVDTGAGEVMHGKDPNDAAAYLSDESRMPGAADKIFFPQSETEVVEILRAAAVEGK